MEDLAIALADRATQVAIARDCRRIALIGLTAEALDVHKRLASRTLAERVCGIFDPDRSPETISSGRRWSELAVVAPDLLVICADAGKERLLEAYDELCPTPDPIPAVVIAGTSHLEYQDPVYAELDAPMLVPSYATGYPLTRVHMFQCLQAAAANEISGAIVEFGCFKGGTTAWLARCARRLGLDSTVIGFDSFEGFPPPRSVFDLYEHPRCVFRGEQQVRDYLEPLGVEVISGDIAATASRRLEREPILLAFVDTDNYTPAAAALSVVAENLVPGGAIVFDHWTTTPEYIYTLGERVAARRVLASRGLLQLYGTGVWIRLR